jgi:hypothetical protein
MYIAKEILFLNNITNIINSDCYILYLHSVNKMSVVSINTVIDVYVNKTKLCYGDNSKITYVLLNGYLDGLIDCDMIDERDKEEYLKMYGDLR